MNLDYIPSTFPIKPISIKFDKKETTNKIKKN